MKKNYFKDVNDVSLIKQLEDKDIILIKQLEKKQKILKKLCRQAHQERQILKEAIKQSLEVSPPLGGKG
jgi:hypothetical protein